MSQVLNLSATGHPAYASLTCSPPSGTTTTTNTMGNQLVETDTTNVRLQTNSIQVGSAMTLGFNYGTTNNNGNLLSQTITRGSQTWVQSYAYTDGLNRLNCANENPSTATACAAGAGNWSRTFGYDPWANGWVASNSNSTLALNSFTPTKKTIGGYTFGYDAENRMTSSAIDSSTSTDATRRRVHHPSD